MIQPILLYGDPVLRKPSENVPRNFPKLEELINDMFETMHKGAGIGLSAIQIGIPLRVFVIEAHIEEENFHVRNVFINPRIKREFGERVKLTEGCLSVPYLSALVERYDRVEMDYYDESWNLRSRVIEGLESRIVQHEYDHLNGVLYIDHLNPMWRRTFDVPLKQIENREIEINYLTK